MAKTVESAPPPTFRTNGQDSIPLNFRLKWAHKTPSRDILSPTIVSFFTTHQSNLVNTVARQPTAQLHYNAWPHVKHETHVKTVVRLTPGDRRSCITCKQPRITCTKTEQVTKQLHRTKTALLTSPRDSYTFAKTALRDKQPCTV